MKLLIVSDTHKDIKRLKILIEREKPDMVMHAGDFDVEEKKIAKLADYYVYGNWDINNQITAHKIPHNATNFAKYLDKSYQVFTLENKKFLLTHFMPGYANNMTWKDKKTDVLQVINTTINSIIKDQKPDYIIFGHTHKPIKHTHLLNPGSLTAPKQFLHHPTFIIATSNDSGKFKFKVKKFKD
ncbi:MAG: metallophosphatase family protein [Mycoplasmataceae bacterium]|nr:metallophosphatase family protein [Mycoplasmataceae bacterium]